MAAALPPINLNTNQELSNKLAQTFSTGGVNINLPPKPQPVAQLTATGLLTPTNLLLAAVVALVAWRLWRD